LGATRADARFRTLTVRISFYGRSMMNVEGYRVEPLTPQTWPAFADLAERHNGVFGGCWCVWFHCHPDPPERRDIGNRAFKQRMVDEGRAHAALVFDGDEAIGGPPGRAERGPSLSRPGAS